MIRKLKIQGIEFEPELTTDQESRNLWVFDKAEAELDGMLGLKGKEIHYA
ncbi:MAG: hypothetical protein LKE21_03170 [Mesosutterella sp.]|jgi:hypothetical protein|nr:hypothetical protein [Mesosutterella sp.]MCH3936703.1 hypothetical protein [Mesosutterella sp.]